MKNIKMKEQMKEVKKMKNSVKVMSGYVNKIHDEVDILESKAEIKNS